MTSADIERLVAERALERLEFDDADIVGYWSKAITALADARFENLSSDGKLQLAYTAGLQMTFAILAAAGFRVKSSASHYKAFYAVQKLGDAALSRFAVRMDELRQARHRSVYEPTEDEIETSRRAAETLSMLDQAVPALIRWLVQIRPTLQVTYMT